MSGSAQITIEEILNAYQSWDLWRKREFRQLVELYKGDGKDDDEAKRLAYQEAVKLTFDERHPLNRAGQ